MIQIFTLDDVVRYVYHEMNENESERLKEALLFDAELMDFYQQLSTTKKSMEAVSIEVSPSKKAINKILQYSRSYDLQETSQ